MTTVTEGRHTGEFLLSEANFHRSRESATIAFSQTLLAGSVLAQIAVVAGVVAAASADAGNTASSGTIAMDGTTPVTPAVKDGRYIGIATAATKVEWSDPNGKVLGVSTHGVAFAKGGIKFTITAGGTPNVAGDLFYVDIAADAEDFQYVALNPAGTDGSAVAVAIALYGAVTPADATAAIAIIARDAEVNGHMIEWPAGISAAAKADAVQSLQARGIIVRN